MAGGGRRLNARAAATTRPGRHGDGAGLYLVVSASGARKWVYRFSFAGKVTEMGLGSADVVSLAQARSKACEARELLDAGQNPIEARRRAARIGAGMSSFGAVAEALMAAKQCEWRCAKHRAQWRMTLQTYAAPLYPRPVDEIDTAAVLAALTPLWRDKPETASRLRGRIEAVLDAAKARGLRLGENPAAWRGHLAHLLPKRKTLARGHHAAMAYADIPAFLARLREREALAARALEFCILTAARSGEEMELGELKRKVLEFAPGQKICYVTDLADNERNRAALAAFLEGADLLFIEAVFLDADRALAERKSHLTARAAGSIARAAGIKSAVPFHFSPRYIGRESELRREFTDAWLRPPTRCT